MSSVPVGGLAGSCGLGEFRLVGDECDVGFNPLVDLAAAHGDEFLAGAVRFHLESEDLVSAGDLFLESAIVSVPPGRVGFRMWRGARSFSPHGGAAGFHGGPDGLGLVDVSAGSVDCDGADHVASVSGPAASVGSSAPVSAGHDVREFDHVPVAWIGVQSYPPFDDLDIVVVLFELPFLDGVFVHEPLRLFEGDALLVVGGGRIVGDGQQSADAFHDSFRIHMFVWLLFRQLPHYCYLLAEVILAVCGPALPSVIQMWPSNACCTACTEGSCCSLDIVVCFS